MGEWVTRVCMCVCSLCVGDWVDLAGLFMHGWLILLRSYIDVCVSKRTRNGIV